MLTHLLGHTDRLRSDPTLGGGILENFIALELLKQRGWSKLQSTLHHFRTHNGDEVDLVLEDRAGRIVFSDRVGETVALELRYNFPVFVQGSL